MTVHGSVRKLPGGRAPALDPTAYTAPGSVVVGAVTLAADSSVWYNAVLRADSDSITLGAGSNIQDGVAVHTDSGHPTVIGRNVSVGHNAVVHGCTVEDDCLIGMGSVVLSGAVIGAGSLVAGGAVVLEGMIVPPGSLVAGVPAKVRRELTADEQEAIRQNAAHYVALRAVHAAAVDDD
ncbi:gamma carbonic anhydrase family protein [Plantibacter sp. VKM Ac-2880]|uniref:gamma carbonic anhydrase family protein n=1 Tax=Plantibacter sp. VKM Ac-2880 TaxID=2783827 RepID=UPI00188E5C0C|nr:gamma carbonic anhydrase family protein [Plantibacter sp. VKM Ac-2880]MBF4568960.1 gamma carbonic anhydrase family protein [Plantibacter sp. VKM Ac-2880]